MADEIILACFRSACSEAADPRGYNRVTHGLYCLPCARRIESQRMHRGENVAPFFPLLAVEMQTGALAGGRWVEGLILIRPDQVPS